MSSTASGTKISSVAGEMAAVMITPSGNLSLFFIIVLLVHRLPRGRKVSPPRSSKLDKAGTLRLLTGHRAVIWSLIYSHLSRLDVGQCDRIDNVIDQGSSGEVVHWAP